VGGWVAGGGGGDRELLWMLSSSISNERGRGNNQMIGKEQKYRKNI